LLERVDQLQVFPGGIPTVEQHRLRLQSFVGNGVDQHVLKVVVFGLAVGGVVINPVIHRSVFLTVTMNQIHHADASHQAAHRTAVLGLDQLDRLRIALVLYAVVDDQERVLGSVDQPLDQLPHLPRRYPALFQEVAHHIVADMLQMLGQVEAGVVDRCADQVFYVTLFRDHVY